MSSDPEKNKKTYGLLIFGILCLLIALACFFLFDELQRTSYSGRFSGIFKFASRNLGREVFCGIIALGGIIFTFLGIKDLMRKKNT